MAKVYFHDRYWKNVSLEGEGGGGGGKKGGKSMHSKEFIKTLLTPTKGKKKLPMQMNAPVRPHPP